MSPVTPQSTTLSRHLRSSPSIEFPELSEIITGLATPSTAPRPRPKPRPVPKPVPVLKGKEKVTVVRRPDAKPANTGQHTALPAHSIIKDSDDDMDVIEVFSSDSERDVGRISPRPISSVHDSHDRTCSETYVRNSSPLTPVPPSRSPSEDVHRPVEAPTTPEPVTSPTTSTGDSYIVTPTQSRFVPSSQPTQDYGGKYTARHVIESETESESDSEDEENPFAVRRGDNRRTGGGGVGSTSNPKPYRLPELSSPPGSSSSRAVSVLTPVPEPRHRRTLVSGPAAIAGSSTSPYKIPRIPNHSDRIWSPQTSPKDKDEDLEVVPSSQSQSQNQYLTMPRDHGIASPERKATPSIISAPMQTTTESGNSSQHPIDWYEVVPSSQSQEIEMRLPEGWDERQAQAIPVASSSSRTPPPEDDPMEDHLSSLDISPIQPPAIHSSPLPQLSSSQESHSSIDIPPHHSTPPPPSLKPTSQASSASQRQPLTSSAERKLQIRDINLHHADLSCPISGSQRKPIDERERDDSETEDESEEDGDEEGQYHVYPEPPERTPTPPSPPRRSISPTERPLRAQSPVAPPEASSSNSEAIGSGPPRLRTPTSGSPSANHSTPDVDAEQRMLRKVYRGLVRYTAKAKARAQSQSTHSQSQIHSQFTQSQSQSQVDSPKFDLKAEMKKLGLDLDTDLDMKLDSQLAMGDSEGEGGFSVPEDLEMLELSDDEDEDGEEGNGDSDWDMRMMRDEELPERVKEVIRRVEAASQV